MSTIPLLPLLVSLTALPACEKESDEEAVDSGPTVEVAAPAVTGFDPATNDKQVEAGEPVAQSEAEAAPVAVATPTVQPASAAALVGVTWPAAGTYGTSGEIGFIFHYSEPVTVSGSPCIIIDLGGSLKLACHDSGSGTSSLGFTYTVAEGDLDADGIALNGSITGGSLTDAGGALVSGDLSGFSADLSSVLVDTSLGITAPGQVDSLISSPTTSNTELSISWSVPADNGTAITYYTVQYRLKGSQTWTSLSPSPVSASAKIAGLTGGETYEVRVAANNGLQGLYSAVMENTLEAVASENFVLWYDSADAATLFKDTACTDPASAGGDSIQCWLDKSDSAKDASGTTGPTLSIGGQNGLNTLAFDRQWLENDFNLSAANYANLTVFTIHKAAVSDPGAIWGSDNGGWDRFLLDHDSRHSFLGDCVSHGSYPCVQTTSPLTDTAAFKMVAITYQDGVADGSAIHIDGAFDQSFTANQTGAAGTMQVGGIGKGGDTTFLFRGEIAELLMYDGALNDTERRELEGYLACKWGLQGSLPVEHPYHTACP